MLKFTFSLKVSKKHIAKEEVRLADHFTRADAEKELQRKNGWLYSQRDRYTVKTEQTP